MIIVMNRNVEEEKIDKVKERLHELGLESHISRGKNKIIIGAVGENKQGALEALEALPYVEQIVPISQPFKMVSREFRPEGTVINLEGKDPSSTVSIGGDDFTLIAGPCAVESRDSILEIARVVKASGGELLRGGAFKPRTSPYSFQGLGEEGLKYLREAADTYQLKVITEVMDTREVELVSQYADVLQIGARNMQNFKMLKAVGDASLPVFLKRGMSATIKEWLMAAEYIMSHGNHEVILCERGIRTFETETRNTLDLAAVARVKQLSHLPVIVDPSHGTGKWKLIPAMSKAALAAGADGVMIEVHPAPEEAFSDGPQSLTFENLDALTQELTVLAPHFQKRFAFPQDEQNKIQA